MECDFPKLNLFPWFLVEILEFAPLKTNLFLFADIRPEVLIIRQTRDAGLAAFKPTK